MSSSNAMAQGSGKKKNKIILGPDSSGLTELSLDELEDRNRRNAWDDRNEDVFFERVRGKAKDKAKEILASAMAEAETIKAKAAEEGRAEGLQAARQEVDAMLGQQAEALAEILQQAQAGSKQLWEAYRQDIVALVRLAVEKVLTVQLEQNHEQILGSLLDEALDNIDSHRELVIRVNPDDSELMRELLERAAQTHTTLANWKIKPDKNMAQGGVILESDQGMVDNSVQARSGIILEIFDKLGITDEEDGENA